MKEKPTIEAFHVSRPMASGWGTMTLKFGKDEIELFGHHPEQLNFEPHEFIGLTVEQAAKLYTEKAWAYLQA